MQVLCAFEGIGKKAGFRNFDPSDANTSRPMPFCARHPKTFSMQYGPSYKTAYLILDNSQACVHNPRNRGQKWGISMTPHAHGRRSSVVGNYGPTDPIIRSGTSGDQVREMWGEIGAWIGHLLGPKTGRTSFLFSAVYPITPFALFAISHELSRFKGET